MFDIHKKLAALTPEQKDATLKRVAIVLYGTPDGWDPEKPLDADAVMLVNAAMHRAGLVPDMADTEVNFYEQPPRGALCGCCWGSRQNRTWADVTIRGEDYCVDCVLAGHAPLDNLQKA